VTAKKFLLYVTLKLCHYFSDLEVLLFYLVQREHILCVFLINLRFYTLVNNYKAAYPFDSGTPNGLR